MHSDIAQFLVESKNIAEMAIDSVRINMNTFGTIYPLAVKEYFDKSEAFFNQAKYPDAMIEVILATLAIYNTPGDRIEEIRTEAHRYAREVLDEAKTAVAIPDEDAEMLIKLMALGVLAEYVDGAIHRPNGFYAPVYQFLIERRDIFERDVESVRKMFESARLEN